MTQQAGRIAAATLLAFALITGTWRFTESRLETEAARLSEEGQSELAPLVVTDWAGPVMATALRDDSDPALRARYVIEERLNVAVADARRGDVRRLVRTAEQVTQAMREAPDTLTQAGAEWAGQVASRLMELAARAPTEDRLRLLVSADNAQAAIAARPLEKPPAVPQPPRAVIAASPRPERLLPASPATPEPTRLPFAQPPTPPSASKPAASPEPVVAAAPSDWKPNWRSLGSIPSGPSADGANDEAGTGAVISLPAPPVATERPVTDRQLLAELLELAELARNPRRATANGPTPAPTDGDEVAARRRLEIVRTELAKRGFRGVSIGQLTELLAADPARRAALARRLPMARSGDGARLLLVLAEDESPAVRVAAILSLGSSTSRQLVETAWRLANRDSDPNVGRLAEPLRQRLR